MNKPLDDDQLATKIEEVLYSLPDAYLYAIILYEEDGLPIDEVAIILEDPIPIIKWRIQRARLLFREEMAKYINLQNEGIYKKVKMGEDFELEPDDEVRQLVRSCKPYEVSKECDEKVLALVGSDKKAALEKNLSNMQDKQSYTLGYFLENIFKSWISSPAYAVG